MDDLLAEFLTETSENLATLDVELVRLEQNPNDPGLIGNIFRLVHTIKGTCGFLGLPRLESVAHAGENVLGKIRDGEIRADANTVTLILECLDRVRMLLAALEATQAEPEGEDKALIAKLNTYADTGVLETDAASSVAPSKAADKPAKVVSTDGAGATPAAQAAQPGSFFALIGGDPARQKIRTTVIAGATSDPLLEPFFGGFDDRSIEAALFGFVDAGIGALDEGGNLGAAFVPLVARGFNDIHFDSLTDHLRAALAGAGLDRAAMDQASALVDSIRTEALTPASQEASDDSAVAQSDHETTERPGAAGATPAVKAASETPEGGSKESAQGNQSIRVRLDLLENLMTMVSELVLTRNQLLQILRRSQGSEFEGPLQRLNHVTSDLQDGIMKTRMQPIGSAWAKLPRIVRDLAHELGKKIDLQMIGADTELDRQVLELIKDPLTHMVRNSGDHGLETPKERKATGKPETGRIVLRASQEGGHIIIEISDDGRGINLARVREKAISSGLATADEIDQMTEQQVLSFIFRAGFSTSAKVTSVSGRGVGMDVVRTNIEKIGGTIELKSTMGKGSAFTIKIPLTLAIVSALIVECSGERFAIPQLSVLELVRASQRSEHKIEHVNATPVLRLRNRLLPLVSLNNMLQLSPHKEAAQSDETFVIVTQVGTYTFGLIVDRVFDTEEIVVKPVAPVLRGISIFSGNTILGDGSVIMILDPNGIAAASGEISRSQAETGSAADAAAERRGEERMSLLVFRGGDSTPRAVPLGLVARLEEVPVEKIEYSNGKPVVQYRDKLMPLVSVSEKFEASGSGRKPVIVFTEGGRAMGLVVDEIIDIVEDALRVELNSGKPGLLGSTVIAGKATDIIDVAHYLNRGYDDWFGTHGGRESFGASKRKRRVLLVDDSAFFRNMLTPVLTTAGYEVTSVDGADRAIALHEAGQSFDLIISDIEMPGMNGFEFAEAVRRTDRWSQTPLLALSSHTSDDDLARGRQVGFTDYVAKLDREALLQSINETLDQRGAA